MRTHVVTMLVTVAQLLHEGLPATEHHTPLPAVRMRLTCAPMPLGSERELKDG